MECTTFLFLAINLSTDTDGVDKDGDANISLYTSMI